MRRSELMRLAGLAAGGEAGVPLANRWYVHHGWTDAARAASLAVRRAKAAARAAAGNSSGGGGDAENPDSPVRVSGFTVNGRGKVSVGFTDYTVDPPVNRYLTEGGEDGGWTIKSADYDAGTAVLAKDGREISVGMGSGGGAALEGSDQSAEGQAADQAEWRDGQGAAGAPVEDFGDAGINAFYDRYGREPVSEEECKEAAGLSGAASDSDLEAVEEWIRERAADEADLGEGEFGGEATENRRRLRRARLSNRADAAAGCLLANVGWTDEARAASLAVRRGGASSVKRDPLSDARDLLAAFPGGIGNRPSPETFEAARSEFARTYCRDPRTPREWAQAFYFLYQFPHANRLRRSGGGALANTGWTDEARAAALLARRAKADARGVGAAPPRIWVAGTPGQDGPPVRGVTGFAGDAAIRAPSPPGEGTIISAGGWISVMVNGRPVRIGSAKVLCVLPDGQLGFKRGGRAYPIGRPAEWWTGIGGARILTSWDGKCMLDVGKGYLDLSTGQVKVKPGQDGVKSGGTVKIEIDRYSPFTGPGVEIPPESPDESQRRYLRA